MYSNGHSKPFTFEHPPYVWRAWEMIHHQAHTRWWAVHKLYDAWHLKFWPLLPRLTRSTIMLRSHTETRGAMLREGITHPSCSKSVTRNIIYGRPLRVDIFCSLKATKLRAAREKLVGFTFVKFEVREATLLLVTFPQLKKYDYPSCHRKRGHNTLFDTVRLFSLCCPFL